MGVFELILYEECSAVYGSEEILDLNFSPFSKKRYSILLQGGPCNIRHLLFKSQKYKRCDLVKCTTYTSLYFSIIYHAALVHSV